MTKSPQKQSIFISYCHKDEDEKDQFIEHFSPLKDYFDVWHDRKIKTGDQWNDQIKTAIDNANMAVLLISKNFLNSEFIEEEELPYILDCQNKNDLKIYPIIIGHCFWEEYTCKDFKLNDTQVKLIDNKPLSEFEGKQRDKVIKEIITDIKNILLKSQQDSTKYDSDAKIDKDSHTGKIVPLLCDRDTHAGEFINFFIQNRKKCKKTPQFYFIHGQQTECPLSMIERLRYHEIKQYFDRKGETIRSPKIKPIKWPETGSFSFRKNELKKNLFSSITTNPYTYMENDYQLKDLYQSNYFEKYKNHVILLPHTLAADQWDQSLMKWYITEYWFDPTCMLDDMPQFLLFFSITCSYERKSFFFPVNLQKRIHKKLEKFTKTLDEKTYPNYLFEPLNKITKEHVRSWFRDHFDMLESIIETNISDIFKQSLEEANMSTVEEYLHKVLKDITINKGESYVHPKK